MHELNEFMRILCRLCRHCFKLLKMLKFRLVMAFKSNHLQQFFNEKINFQEPKPILMDIKLKSQLRKITTFIFDVDGVLTDATIIALRGGELARVFNVKDGYALGKAIRSGFRIAIISGGKEESIRERLSLLGIKDIFLGVNTDKKLSVFDKYIADNNISADETVFMGDDLPDWEIMKHRDVLSACPADAVEEIIEIAAFNSTRKGGDCAVREVIELVMKEQGKWMKIF